jgi:hypothetical protein
MKGLGRIGRQVTAPAAGLRRAPFSLTPASAVEPRSGGETDEPGSIGSPRARKHRPDGRPVSSGGDIPTAAGRPRGVWAGKRNVAAGRPAPHPARSAGPRGTGGKTNVLCEPAKPEGGNPPNDPHPLPGKKRTMPEIARNGGIRGHTPVGVLCVPTTPGPFCAAWSLTSHAPRRIN